ncbi:MAG: hypothetical protein WDN27_03800 [Candidatus Saccharibacteria bacterium]
MFYYFVWVRSSRYHGSEPLTYASKTKLALGSIVRVELQKEVVLGFVSGPTTEPPFPDQASRRSVGFAAVTNSFDSVGDMAAELLSGADREF